MKRNMFGVLMLLVSLVVVSVFAVPVFANSLDMNYEKAEKEITAQEAKKIALKKVEGKVEEEYTIENDDDKITAYVFIIKRKDSKIFEVQVSAADGKVLSVTEQEPE